MPLPGFHMLFVGAALGALAGTGTGIGAGLVAAAVARALVLLPATALGAGTVVLAGAARGIALRVLVVALRVVVLAAVLLICHFTSPDEMGKKRPSRTVMRDHTTGWRRLAAASCESDFPLRSQPVA